MGKRGRRRICNRDCMQPTKPTFITWPFTESLLTPALVETVRRVFGPASCLGLALVGVVGRLSSKGETDQQWSRLQFPQHIRGSAILVLFPSPG